MRHLDLGGPLGPRASEAGSGQGARSFGCFWRLRLPAMGWHYGLPKQKAPTKAGASAESGAGNRNRTYDLRITNAPLYQLSYSG